MSWGVSVTSTPKKDLERKLEESFYQSYPSSGEGVEAQFEAALEAAGTLLNEIDDSELYHASLNGHVGQGDNNPTYINVSVGGY